VGAWGLFFVFSLFLLFSCFSVEVSSCILLVYLGAPYAFIKFLLTYQKKNVLNVHYFSDLEGAF
jgi:hypothetical protein